MYLARFLIIIVTLYYVGFIVYITVLRHYAYVEYISDYVDLLLLACVIVRRVRVHKHGSI